MTTWNQLRDEMFPPGTERRRSLDRHLFISRRTEALLNAVFGWTQRIFWFLLFEHDMERTVAFRPANAIDGLTFAFLNDGMRPTLWHTWTQIRYPDGSDYVGIYPGGAPRNRAEADTVRAAAR
jgi:hypothetical protein